MAGVAILLVSAPPASGQALELGQLGLSVLIFSLGIYTFWQHGGHQVTAAGVFSLAFSMFVGFSGFYLNLHPEHKVTSGLYLATAICFAAQWLLSEIMWARPPTYARLDIPEPATTAWGLRLGLLLCVLGTAAMMLIEGASQIALCGFGVLLAALIAHRPQSASPLIRLSMAGVIVLLSAIFVFSAFGRLKLVALGLTAVIAASSLGYRRVKGYTLLALPPALSLLVAYREAEQRETGFEEDGIGSVVAPLNTFGMLIDGRLGGAGDTFLASLVWWVPRQLWPDKPRGLGSELAYALRPDLADRGHSMASTVLGEGYFNLGLLGLPMFVLFFALAIRYLDSVYSGVLQKGLQTPRDLIRWLVSLTLMAEVPALAWSGSFTYSTRAGLKVAILLVLGSLLTRPSGSAGPLSQPTPGGTGRFRAALYRDRRQQQ